MPSSTDTQRVALLERVLQAAGPVPSYPLSFAQQRLWFLDQLDPASPLYNMPTALRLSGPLNVPALEQALNALVARHETLRTRFVEIQGEPVQVIDEAVQDQLPVEDLSAWPESERDTLLGQKIQEEASRPFHLSTDRLMRGGLLRLSLQEHVLLLTLHHIISDERSFEILFAELAAFYQAFATGVAVSLPELPIQYSDYALWQRDWLQGETYERQLRFWRKQLNGHPSAVELPTDRPRRPRQGGPGAGQWRAFGKPLAERLRQLAQRERATLFMVLLAAFKTLLYRYTRQEDLIVGSPISGRTRLETEGLIGFFVNTLALRTRLSGEQSFLQLLAQVREVALGAFSNQEFPFDKLVEALHPERAAHQTPFVNVMFFAQSVGEGAVQWPGLRSEFLDAGPGMAKFDLTLQAHDRPDNLLLVAQYNADLFEPETVERLLEHFQNLLEGIVEQPTRMLAELPLLSPAERHRVLIGWNETRVAYPHNRCVHELFEEQAREHAEAVALVYGEHTLSYGDLNSRANQVAHYLRRAGVQPGTLLGLCMERSAEMIVGMLGILKSGAAYAPLDPSAPPDRLASMLEDLRLPVLLTQRALVKRMPACDARVLCLDTDWRRLAHEPTTDLCSESDPEEVAYVSFTSGSTGRPKGVCVPHRGIVRLVRNNPFVHFGPDEVFLQLGPISFDASLFEIWGSLLNGARLVLAPPHLPSLAELAELLPRHRVTTAWFTTGLFNQIVEEGPDLLRGLRQVLTGGDVASPPHIKKALGYLKEGRLVNGYGPTENSTFTACYEIPADFDGEQPVPIGRPIANTECFVLDERLQPVPAGVPGELYVGGDGLAVGYLNRRELTAERFIANPFQPGGRLYKTGDLVRYRSDGNLEFLGRMDLQVKIRGFRVEPGEIEATLLKHASVRQCAVIARLDPTGTKQLISYFVPMEGTAPSTDQLQRFLRQYLPEYMVPAIFVSLEKLPLSFNGKVDRHALPAPDFKRALKPSHRPPRDELERQLQALWETVLEVRPIGLGDKFFALGGHSLLAVRLVAQLERQFGRRLPVAAIFENPTIEQLARLLRGGPTLGASSAIVEIQSEGSKPPLFLVHGAGGGMFWGYSNLARHLGSDQPVFAFKSRGLDGMDELESIEALAKAYVADLRAFQPHGPYYLGGYCFGGVIAYEMARCLTELGQRVALLALLNSSPPNSSYGQFRWTPVTAWKFARNQSLKALHFLRLKAADRNGFVQWRARLWARRWRAALGRGAEPEGLDPDQWLDLSHYSGAQRRLWQTHLCALRAYRPQPYAGEVTLFRSPVHLRYCSFDDQYGWGEFALGGVTVRIIPGAHETIMEEPRVQRLAEELRPFLA